MFVGPEGKDLQTCLPAMERADWLLWLMVEGGEMKLGRPIFPIFHAQAQEELTMAPSNILTGLVQSLVGQVGGATLNQPDVKAALIDAQAQIDAIRTRLYIASAIAGVVVLFYFVPRFEAPIPRVWRKRR